MPSNYNSCKFTFHETLPHLPFDTRLDDGEAWWITIFIVGSPEGARTENEELGEGGESADLLFPFGLEGSRREIGDGLFLINGMLDAALASNSSAVRQSAAHGLIFGFSVGQGKFWCRVGCFPAADAMKIMN